MTWIKRNLVFVIGAVVVLAVTGLAFFYASESRVESRESKAGDAGRGAFPPSNLDPRRSTDLGLRPEQGKVEPAAVQQSGSTSDARLTLRCRAVIPSQAVGDAETAIAYALQSELQASTNLFNPGTTELGPEIHRDRGADTFTFDVTLALRRPIKL